MISWPSWWEEWTSAARMSDECLHKSYNLFMSWLTPSQRVEWNAHYSFTVIGSKGGKYIIHDNANYNIECDKDGARYCLTLHPFGALWPRYDRYLAQKLAIEFDESVMNRANREWSLNRSVYNEI